jgi:hypothetical protein
MSVRRKMVRTRATTSRGLKGLTTIIIRARFQTN